MEIRERFERAHITAEAYPEFVYFCEDAMRFLGFKMTWMQYDIAEYMQYAPDKAMVQAQRGEAKSTIACIYGVWSITQQLPTRVMLVSASGAKADENGVLMYGLVHNWDKLEYLIPDKSAGDRTSTSMFDIHYALKGVDKSPSVVCLGITANLAGFRASLLIPDDIETQKTGGTAVQREQLLALSKEFTAICERGRILYLGTPQSRDSIYNTLPSRGYDVRIWPGRFPTPTSQEKYGQFLAPSIMERAAVLGPRCLSGGGLDGSLGWATDPERFDEAALQTKELDYGPEGFQLQYLLDTSLMDAARLQLKLKDLIIGDFSHDSVPEILQWAPNPTLKLDMRDSYVPNADLYLPAHQSSEFVAPSNVLMTLDPAGDGGDEVAFAIGGVVGPYIHCMAAGGLRGGFTDENMQSIVDLCKRFGVKNIKVEKNFGAGTVSKLLLQYFKGIDPDTHEERLKGVGLEDVPSGNAQKEARIIDTLRPVMERHRLVLHRTAIEMDIEYCKVYGRSQAAVYSLLYQLSSITKERGSLTKDDRVDALEQLVRGLMGHLVKDEEREAELRRLESAKQFINNPMGVRPGMEMMKTKQTRGRIARRRG